MGFTKAIKGTKQDKQQGRKMPIHWKPKNKKSRSRKRRSEGKWLKTVEGGIENE